MTRRIDELYEEYVRAWHDGAAPDASAFLDRAPEEERDELADLLETFVLAAPVVEPTPQRRAELEADPAFRRAAGLVDAVAPVPDVPWGERLRAARERAGLSLGELGARFASSFGLAGREHRAGRLLQQLEDGELPAAGVAPRASARLAELLGTTVASLAPPPPAAPAPLFRAEPDAASQLGDLLASASQALGDAAADQAGERDELDRLLRGG